MREVKRPWGGYRLVGRWSGRITVKILRIAPGSRISLQKHRAREEEWLCLRGTAEVQIGGKVLKMAVGDRASVRRDQLHRIYSRSGAELLEISFGKFSERDIVRVEDDYGRA